MKTKDGREIPLRPVGRRYVEQVMARFPVPDPPTYEAQTVAGDVEVHPHQVQLDAAGEVVKTTLQTDEEWTAWREYQAAKEQAITDRYQAATEFLVYQCVDLEPSPLDEWEVDFTLWELESPDPDDPKAFKLFWVENELLPDPDDQAVLMAELYRIGGLVREDQVKNFEQFFRSTLARLGAGGSGSKPAGRPADSGPTGRDGDA